MSFTGTPILDSLQSAGGLSANFTTPSLGDAGTVLEGSVGAFPTGAGTPASAFWNVSKFGPDSQAFATFGALPPSGGNNQVFVRLLAPTGSTSGYFVRCDPVSGSWSIRKKLLGGASTSLGTGTQTCVAGDGFGIEIVGNILSAMYRAGAGSWSVLFSTTDNSALINEGGYIGFTASDNTATTVRLINFGGSTIAIPSENLGPPPVLRR